MSLLTDISSLEDLDLENQRVFVRADLDAPFDKSGAITDDTRIVQAVPTIRELLRAGARVVVGSRFGEAKSGPGTLSQDKAPSIEAAAHKLAEHLEADVLLPDGCTGDSVRKVISSLREGQVCVLENLASDDDVGSGAEAFARTLFEFVDMYVGDAPRLLGFESATTTILPRLFERRVAGRQMRRELEAIAHVRSNADRPRLFIWGGNSLTERLPLLQRLLAPGDRVFFVGVPANTLVRARGGATGRSTIEENYLAGARTLLDQLDGRCLLPEDFAVGESPKAVVPTVARAGEIGPLDMALDLGPASRASLAEHIAEARSVIWCGNVGFHRNPAFQAGTRALLEALAATSAFTLVAGEDSVAAAQALGEDLKDRIGHVSMGGPATLSLLAESKLIGLEALRGMSHDSAHTSDRR